MPENRFSRLYVQTKEFTQDSDRARYRIAALFREPIFNDHAEQLALYVSRTVGVPILSSASGRCLSQWNQFICGCRTPDFLDAITLVYRYLFWHISEDVAYWWRDVVRQIFADEHLAYQIDDAGGVHPAVDQEFQRNIVSTVAALQSHRYQSISQSIEIASSHLYADPPNYKMAWRAMLLAVEGLFGLKFPHARLTPEEILRRLLPAVESAYKTNSTAQKATRAILTGFQGWVEASLMYRHQPGVADAPDPPADIAILAISHGASFIRWLADLDVDSSESVQLCHDGETAPHKIRSLQWKSGNRRNLTKPRPSLSLELYNRTLKCWRTAPSRRAANRAFRNVDTKAASGEYISSAAELRMNDPTPPRGAPPHLFF